MSHDLPRKGSFSMGNCFWHTETFPLAWLRYDHFVLSAYYARTMVHSVPYHWLWKQHFVTRQLISNCILQAEGTPTPRRRLRSLSWNTLVGQLALGLYGALSRGSLWWNLGVVDDGRSLWYLDYVVKLRAYHKNTMIRRFIRRLAKVSLMNLYLILPLVCHILCRNTYLRKYDRADEDLVI